MTRLDRANTEDPLKRDTLVRWALWLEALTLAWMAVEASVALATGVAAHSLTLAAFGADSVIELASALVLVWRLRVELVEGRTYAEASERRASRIAGGLLLVLAAIIAAGATWRFLSRTGQNFSAPGLAVAAAAIPLMAALGRAKLRVAGALGSAALRADAMESIACFWLSAVVVADLAAQLLVGAWWLDAAGVLVLVPLLVKEGGEAWRGEACCDDD
jgi:divalent metal cation (Fe/Co/Zn/Cd) transporter